MINEKHCGDAIVMDDVSEKLIQIGGYAGSGGIKTMLIFKASNDNDLFKAFANDKADIVCEYSNYSDLMQREVEWAANSRGHSYSIRTSSAYKLSVAYAITENLRRHYKLSDEAGYNIYTATHEALMNAMVRGNLGIEALYSDSEGFKYYVDRIEKAMATAEAEKRIRISLWQEKEGEINIEIEDQGFGFDPANIPHNSLGRVSGRGFIMIESCSICYRHNDKGNVIAMTLALE